MKKKKISAKIIGTGSHLPDRILTNDDLSEMVDTSDDWITERTGIKERRVVDDKTSTSDLAFLAAQKILKDANTQPEELELIIVCTTSPDMFFPSTSCILQNRLKATNAAAFDVSAACSGFNFGLSVATQYIETGAYKKILLIGVDTLSKFLDWEDRNTCVLFGDAAGGVVLEPATDGTGVQANFLAARGAGGEFLKIPGGGSRNPMTQEAVDKKLRYIQMNGREVFKFAVNALVEGVGKVLDLCELEKSQIDLLIPHQANQRIIDFAAKKLGLPKEKVYVNLYKYGNTSAASIPLAIDEAAKEGKIKKDDVVVLCGFGAGLTFGANLLVW